MIDLGNGQYQIRNSQTGETKTVGSADLPKYGLSAPKASTPEDKLTGLPKILLNLSQGAGGLLHKLGLGAIPDILSQSGMAQGVQRTTGINPVLSTEDRQTMQTPLDMVKRGAGDAAGAASWMLPGGELAQGIKQTTHLPGILGSLFGHGATGALRGEAYGMSQTENPVSALPFAAGGAALEPVMAAVSPLIKFPTKGSLYKKGMEPAAAKATGTRNWDDLVKQAQQTMTERYGPGVEARNAVGEVSSQFAPPAISNPNAMGGGPSQVLQEAPQFQGWSKAGEVANIPEGATATGIKSEFFPQGEMMPSATGDLNASQLLKMRSQMGNLYGKNALQKVFDNLLGKSGTTDKAAGVFKQVLSKNLKELAPQIAQYDKLYGMYSNPLVGSPSRIGIEILGGLLLKSILGNAIGNKATSVVGGVAGY